MELYRQIVVGRTSSSRIPVGGMCASGCVCSWRDCMCDMCEGTCVKLCVNVCVWSCVKLCDLVCEVIFWVKLYTCGSMTRCLKLWYLVCEVMSYLLCEVVISCVWSSFKLYLGEVVYVWKYDKVCEALVPCVWSYVLPFVWAWSCTTLCVKVCTVKACALVC